MQILFVLRHSGNLRLFGSTIRELARRNHEVRLVFTDPSDRALEAMTRGVLDELTAEENISTRTWTSSPSPRTTVRDPRITLHWWQDYLRYLEPAFADAPKLRDRAAANLSPQIRAASGILAQSPELLAVVRRALAVTERALVEPTTAAQSLLADEPVDLVVVSPLIGRSRKQLDIARAARARGAPVAFCCASWDNLTTSGLIHADLDAVMVWNQAQRNEAVSLHGVPVERVVVTGAPAYDVWFESMPTHSRAEWCTEVGLDAAHPYLLYVCSSRFVAGDEVGYISRWVGGLRTAADPEVRDVRVLVRPHPQNVLDTARLTALDGVSVHPQPPELPLGEEARARYVNAIHHSAAVVGVNTSAMIESAILGRGVHVHLTKRYRQTQAGTLHFRHLLAVGGGLLKATASLAEHHAGLCAALRGDDAEATAKRAQAFLHGFVRPAGLDRPATPLLARALEDVAASMGKDRAALAITDPFGVGPAAAQVCDALLRLAGDTGRGGRRGDEDPSLAARRALLEGL